MSPIRRRYQFDLMRYYRIPAVQISLNIVLSILIVSIFAAFAIRPTLVTIAKLQKNIEDSKKTLTTLEAKVKALNTASKNLEKIKPSLPRLDEVIPTTEAGYNSMLITAEALALQSGVELASVNLGGSILFSKIVEPYKPDKKEDVILLPYSIKLVGSYPGCMNFLQSLANVPRLFGVESVNFSKEGSAKNTVDVVTSLTITGNTYYIAHPDVVDKVFPPKKEGK